MIFDVSEEERNAGALDEDKLASIVEQIETTGFAVVTGLISIETCNLQMQALLEDVEQVRALGAPTHHEKATGEGHLQLGLRRTAPYVKPDLIANPLIEHIVAGVLGEGAWLGFYNGNVNLPGSVHQPLHADRPFSWRTEEEAARDGQSWPPPTTTLSCSVALTEITEENGATEIYPGTHRETAVIEWPQGERISNHPDLMEAWGPPGRMPIPRGGICFRDPRMWHRGVPNPSDEVRPMIALTYHAGRCLSARGRLIHDLDAAEVEACRNDSALKIMDDGELGDGRLLFEESARDAVERTPSQHGVNRNVKFIAPPQRVNHFKDAHRIGGARVVDGPEISAG